MIILIYRQVIIINNYSNAPSIVHSVNGSDNMVTIAYTKQRRLRQDDANVQCHPTLHGLSIYKRWLEEGSSTYDPLKCKKGKISFLLYQNVCESPLEWEQAE